MGSVPPSLTVTAAALNVSAFNLRGPITDFDLGLIALGFRARGSGLLSLRLRFRIFVRSDGLSPFFVKVGNFVFVGVEGVFGSG